MTMTRRKTTELAAAKRKGSLVRITRRVERGKVAGYVVGASEQWLLLLLVGEGITYAGFEAYRIQDVTSLDVPSPYATFYEAGTSQAPLAPPDNTQDRSVLDPGTHSHCRQALSAYHPPPRECRPRWLPYRAGHR